MQRGLRLNSSSPPLWHEYFRLELVYVEKIKARRKILGIDGRSRSTLEELEGWNDQATGVTEDENMIMLPKITGEEFEEEKGDGRSAVKKLEESVVQAMKEENNPVFGGALAGIVFRNAIVGKCLCLFIAVISWI